jgi:hypothetical protein
MDYGAIDLHARYSWIRIVTESGPRSSSGASRRPERPSSRCLRGARAYECWSKVAPRASGSPR